jgi:hypothetical protein
MLTFRTGIWPAGTRGLNPVKFAFLAKKTSFFLHNGIIATPDVDRLAIDKGVSHGIAGVLNNAAKGCPGNTHSLSRVFVGKTQEVSQAKRFSLVNRKLNFFQVDHGYASRFEITGFRIESH